MSWLNIFKKKGNYEDGFLRTNLLEYIDNEDPQCVLVTTLDTTRLGDAEDVILDTITVMGDYKNWGFSEGQVSEYISTTRSLVEKNVDWLEIEEKLTLLRKNFGLKL
jgi:hypothetical protein